MRKKIKIFFDPKKCVFLMVPGPQYTAQCWTHEDLLDESMNL